MTDELWGICSLCGGRCRTGDGMACSACKGRGCMPHRALNPDEMARVEATIRSLEGHWSPWAVARSLEPPIPLSQANLLLRAHGIHRPERPAVYGLSRR